MNILPRINYSLLTQVSHGTLNRIFDHAEAKAGRADAVPWGHYHGLSAEVHNLKNAVNNTAR